MTDDDYIAADAAEMTLATSDEAMGLSLEGSANDDMATSSVFSSPVLDSIRACD